MTRTTSTLPVTPCAPVHLADFAISANLIPFSPRTSDPSPSSSDSPSLVSTSSGETDSGDTSSPWPGRSQYVPSPLSPTLDLDYNNPSISFSGERGRFPADPLRTLPQVFRAPGLATSCGPDSVRSNWSAFFQPFSLIQARLTDLPPRLRLADSLLFTTVQ